MDKAYFNNSFNEFLKQIETFPVWNLTKKEISEKVIKELREGHPGKINTTLRETWDANLNKAVTGVLGTPVYGNKLFNAQLKAQVNVSRFAAFKSYQATKMLKGLKTDDKEFENKVKKVINTFNRFQVTEFNTFTARARTAKQWEAFRETRDLYPNIRWLPSRSAHPREEHMAYYYRVWPMDDPFWDTNQPGNEWNCKCDWEETDIFPTDNSSIEVVPPSPGLEGNPGKTGTLITDNHPYIKFTSQVLREEVSNDLRATFRDQAISSLVGKSIKQVINGENVNIEITKTGIKHIAGDFDADRDFKNALLPHLDKVLKDAKYVERKDNYKPQDKMVKYYHSFSFDILERTGYLHVQELVTGGFRLYAYRHKIK